MHELTLRDLKGRLDRLETENRYWRVATACAPGIILLLGATSATPPDEIKAKRFVAVDDAGRPRMEMGQLPEQDVMGQHKMGLALYDEYRAPGATRRQRGRALWCQPFPTLTRCLRSATSRVTTTRRAFGKSLLREVRDLPEQSQRRWRSVKCLSCVV
jgi:hypothetical protein